MKRCKLVPSVVGLAIVSGLGFSQEPVRENPAQEFEMVVPAGTILPVILSAYLNTRSTQAGDTFYADTSYPIWIQQRLVIPRGSTIRGTVTEVVRPGRIKGKGRIAIRFDDILLPNGVRRNMVAAFRGIHGPGEEKIDRKTETIEMDSSKGLDAGQVAGPAGQGGIIGAVSGGGKGAAIGAGAGAGVGLATILITRGRELVLEPGTQFDIELKQPLRFAFGELEFTQSEMDSARHVTTPRPRYDRQQNPRPGYIPGPRLPIPF